MKSFLNILTFRTMLSPVLLQVLFWAGLFGCFYGSYVLFTLENSAWWMPLIAGPILVRVIFERALLSFRSYDRQQELIDLIRNRQ